MLGCPVSEILGKRTQGAGRVTSTTFIAWEGVKLMHDKTISTIVLVLI